MFNNGGVTYPPVEQLTADGFDMQFGTNVLGACAIFVPNHCSSTTILRRPLLPYTAVDPTATIRRVAFAGRTRESDQHVLYGTYDGL